MLVGHFHARDAQPPDATLAGLHPHDPTLAEFSFIIEWPKLSRAQKQEKYSKYACHELNFFISRKDPEFFRDVVPETSDLRHVVFFHANIRGKELEGGGKFTDRNG